MYRKIFFTFCKYSIDYTAIIVYTISIKQREDNTMKNTKLELATMRAVQMAIINPNVNIERTAKLLAKKMTIDELKKAIKA